MYTRNSLLGLTYSETFPLSPCVAPSLVLCFLCGYHHSDQRSPHRARQKTSRVAWLLASVPFPKALLSLDYYLPCGALFNNSPIYRYTPQ